MQSRHGHGMTLSACLWMGLFPLFQCGTYSGITRHKWVFMLVLTGITVLFFLFDMFFRRNRRVADIRKESSEGAFLPLVLCGALLVWIVLACFFSKFDSSVWLLAEDARMEGLLTQLVYCILFCCFFFSRVHLRPVLYSAAAGVLVFLIITLLQRAGGNPLGLYPPGTSYELNPEFQGTIGNIDMGTGYLLLLFGLFLYAFLRILPLPAGFRFILPDKTVSHRITPRTVFPAVIYLTGLLVSVWLIITMDVQFGIISLGVLSFVTLLRFLPKRWRLPLVIFLVLAALLIVWFWPGQSGGIWELHEILHGRGRLSFGSNRIAVWDYSLRMSKDHLLLGGGSGTFPFRFNRFLSEQGLVIPTEQDGIPLPHYFDNPHNEYISQLADHGLPAALLFAGLLLCSVFRRRDRCLPLLTPCSAAVLCYMVQAVFSFSVCIVAPVFWVILALSFTDPV